MCVQPEVDMNISFMFLAASLNVQREIRDLQSPRLLEDEEIITMIHNAMKAQGAKENPILVHSEILKSQWYAFKIIDEQRLALIKAQAETEKLKAEKSQEKESTPLEVNLEKLFMDWEQHKKETAMRFEGLEKKEGIQNTIDDDQLKMAMAKIDKLVEENSNLKDQATSNFFEMEHKDKNILVLTATMDELEMEVQECYQSISILQKDLQDSENSNRELLKSHDRVVQDLKDQKGKDDEQIQDLLKKQDGNTTRIEELLKRNRLLRSGATSRVQALKDTVAKQDREIAELEKLAHPWK